MLNTFLMYLLVICISFGKMSVHHYSLLSPLHSEYFVLFESCIFLQVLHLRTSFIWLKIYTISFWVNAASVLWDFWILAFLKCMLLILRKYLRLLKLLDNLRTDEFNFLSIFIKVYLLLCKLLLFLIFSTRLNNRFAWITTSCFVP